MRLRLMRLGPLCVDCGFLFLQKSKPAAGENPVDDRGRGFGDENPISD